MKELEIRKIIRKIIKKRYVYDDEIPDHDLKHLTELIEKLTEAIDQKQYELIHWFIGGLTN